MMSFLYKQNYVTKFAFLVMISAALCAVSALTGYDIMVTPEEDITKYHSEILTINSIFSGFALTNLGILLSISDDQLVKKLEGTDILQKRNIVIGHSIIFGAISILVSMLWVLNINFAFAHKVLNARIIETIKEFLNYIEMLSLIASIAYFLLSIKKMIQLLAMLHVPRKRYSDKQIEDMKNKIYDK